MREVFGLVLHGFALTAIVSAIALGVAGFRALRRDTPSGSAWVLASLLVGLAMIAMLFRLYAHALWRGGFWGWPNDTAEFRMEYWRDWAYLTMNGSWAAIVALVAFGALRQRGAVGLPAPTTAPDPRPADPNNPYDGPRK